MDATKDFEHREMMPRLRLRYTKSIPNYSGEIIIVETARKICMGFYCDSDVSHNLYLTHVTIVSKDNSRSHRRLRRCWIKNHMIRNMFVIESIENTSKARDEMIDRHRGNVYANEEVWNKRVPRGRFQNSEEDHKNLIMLSKSECNMDLSRIACDRKEWRCAHNKEQGDIIEDFSEHPCDKQGSEETTLHYTGVHVWKHITPGGKSWDVNTMDNVGDVDVRRAVTDVHWGDGIVASDVS